MNIRPSAAIRQNYNEIADLCKKSKEPVYLTKNGEGDLVVMDIESFERREKELKLAAKLMEIREARLNGARYYTIEETVESLRATLKASRERKSR
ncbi:MAG: type II toxin-antitoxin system Phd/YefM family antitoxin [Oscillospiraceae bacterium]|nr:type II toxin-antitoxin system Phd/YefM family antitoxin [Oscillospiraceae bacterium]